jgi:5-formyltetrahydrofolate cyclo-ligase
LGRGGGYYDALLRGRRGVAVGLAFECQLRRRLPLARHDAPVDAVATERRLLTRG